MSSNVSHCSASTSDSDHPSLSVPAPVRTTSGGRSVLQQGHLHHCPRLHFYDNAAVVLGTGWVGPLRFSVHELQGVGRSASGAPSTLFLCEMKALPGSSAPAEARGWKPGCVLTGLSPLEFCPQVPWWGVITPRVSFPYTAFSLDKLKSPISLTCH